MEKSIYFLIRNYGLLSGLLVYLKIKLDRKGKINLPDVKFPLIYRAKSVDVYSFVEIFFERHYDTASYKIESPKLIIDGGANIGFTSVFYANRFPEAKIVAVEPEGENFELLKTNTSSYKNVTPIRAAIWSSASKIVVKDHGYGLRGFMVEKAQEDDPHAMSALSISDLMQGFPAIDILKLDIEGSEKYVFENNYEAWLPKVKCLIIEIHDNMIPGCSKSVFEAVGRYNFSCYIEGHNLVFVNEAMIEA